MLLACGSIEYLVFMKRICWLLIWPLFFCSVPILFPLVPSRYCGMLTSLDKLSVDFPNAGLIVVICVLIDQVSDMSFEIVY